MVSTKLAPKGKTRAPGARRKEAAAAVSRSRRPRRSTQEIVDRLIEAAGEEFERNGYAGTTTATIARRANVAEFLIYRHFGSKSKLFEDSIFKPLNRHFEDFCATHLVDMRDKASLEKESRQYILELLRFLQHHSKALMSVLVTQIYENDGIERLSHISGLNEYFARAEAMRMNRRPGKSGIDPKLMPRISFIAIAACLIFKRIFFPQGFISDEELHSAICDFVMKGIQSTELC